MTVAQLIEDLKKLQDHQLCEVDLMIMVSNEGHCKAKCTEVHLEHNRIVLSNDR